MPAAKRTRAKPKLPELGVLDRAIITRPADLTTGSIVIEYLFNQGIQSGLNVYGTGASTTEEAEAAKATIDASPLPVGFDVREAGLFRIQPFP